MLSSLPKAAQLLAGLGFYSRPALLQSPRLCPAAERPLGGVSINRAGNEPRRWQDSQGYSGLALPLKADWRTASVARPFPTSKNKCCVPGTLLSTEASQGTRQTILMCDCAGAYGANY